MNTSNFIGNAPANASVTSSHYSSTLFSRTIPLFLHVAILTADQARQAGLDNKLSTTAVGAFVYYESFMKYSIYAAIGGFFLGSTNQFLNKLQDSEFGAKEQADYIAEYTIYALEMVASTIALSYGLHAYMFFHSGRLMNDLLIGEEYLLVNNLEGLISKMICASNLVGDCGGNIISIDIDA